MSQGVVEIVMNHMWCKNQGTECITEQLLASQDFSLPCFFLFIVMI